MHPKMQSELTLIVHQKVEAVLANYKQSTEVNCLFALFNF